MVNVTIYSIHGSYGIWVLFFWALGGYTLQEAFAKEQKKCCSYNQQHEEHERTQYKPFNSRRTSKNLIDHQKWQDKHIYRVIPPVRWKLMDYGLFPLKKMGWNIGFYMVSIWIIFPGWFASPIPPETTTQRRTLLEARRFCDISWGSLGMAKDQWNQRPETNQTHDGSMVFFVYMLT